MVERLKKVFGRVELRILCALALGVLTATLIYSVAQEKDDPPYDEEECKEILSYQLNHLYDLEQWYAEQQHAFLPLLPPFSDFILKNQPGQPNLLPFSAEKFPTQFQKGLVGIYDYSVPVYPIRIEEDPNTRALKFYNYDGQLIYTLAAASGYDPYAYLKDRMPGLYANNANIAGRNYWQSIYDPARVQISVNLIAPEDVEHWLHAKAQVEAAAQEEAEEGGGMMLRVMQENATTNIQFTQIKKVTNGVSMTISYPSGFTNGLDVFMCNELVPEIWSFAAKSLATTGTNLTWVDTNAWVQSGNPVRMYAAGDATKDSDGDGYADGREIMVYDTDPNSATSRPVVVSGTVSYGGPETGTIYVTFTTESDTWSLAKSTALGSPGIYTNNEIANNQSYWFNAFRDVNGNFTRDAWEPWGTYSANSTLITGDTSGINITLADVPSVWGTISYSGSATGDIHVIAVTSSNSWDTTYQTVLPWTESESNELGGTTTYLTFPANYSIVGMPKSNYWLRAFVDENFSGTFTPGEAVGEYAPNSIPVSNRVAGVNITLNLDSDGGGFPDFVELYLTGTSATNATDGILLLNEARQQISMHWLAIHGGSILFTNTPGSTADREQIKHLLEDISDKFYTTNSP